MSPRGPKGELISDRYRIEDRLGSGGMSSVFRAQDTILERTVAVKILAEHLSDDERFVARFRREALAVAKLVHILIASPAIYYLSQHWLSNFAYHIELTAWYFIAPALITLVIVLITSGYHGIKNSRVNPVDILKYE